MLTKEKRMASTMTAADWAKLLPGLPESSSSATEIGDILHAMETTAFADVLAAVFLPTPWPGMLKPELDLQAAVLAQVGRWYVTVDGLVCLDENYWITADRFDEDDWFAHVIAKSWLYDPADLLQALEQAYAHILPDTTPAMRTALLDRHVQRAIAHHKLLFAPTILQHQHLYLINRMTQEERRAFCTYLADAGFVARS